MLGPILPVTVLKFSLPHHKYSLLNVMAVCGGSQFLNECQYTANANWKCRDTKFCEVKKIQIPVAIVSDLVARRHEEDQASEQQAQVERLVTLSGASFHLNEKQSGGEEQYECQCERSGGVKSPGHQGQGKVKS